MRAIILNPIETEIGGVSLLERSLRMLQHEKISTITILREGVAELPVDDDALVMWGRVLLDPRIVHALLSLSGSVVAIDRRAGSSCIGIARLEPSVLERFQYRLAADPMRALQILCDECTVFDIATLDDYVPKLRRRVPIYWVEIKSRAHVARAEKILLESSEKDPSDLMAILHRPIENWAVRKLARTPITPNQITVLVNLLAWAVTALFITQNFLIGALLSFLVGLLDGFDGKLARLKGMVTRLGSLEHSFDLLFEFSWVLALGYALSHREGSISLLLSGLIVTLVAFYRSVYERYGHAAGMSLDVAGKFEQLFRRVAGRRNLYNLHILGWILANVPMGALWSILAHALLTALVYSVQAIRHLRRLDTT
ncbi:MAG: CDP-alcohol phosphatidyltransferase family protein [Candidatus Bipolaricaulota bacterium]|nr:CDP-alcohol phosphatidyltransferase family protein [Candidatus Bipolaricaulota bacterium]